MSTKKKTGIVRGGRLRPLYGAEHPRATLTSEMVVEIRRNLAEGRLSAPKIAAIFAVSERTIYHIRRGDTWRHVPVESCDTAKSITRAGMNKAAAKLRDRDIPEIRAAIDKKETITSVAGRYMVSRTVIRAIRDSKAWTHVQGSAQ